MEMSPEDHTQSGFGSSDVYQDHTTNYLTTPSQDDACPVDQTKIPITAVPDEHLQVNVPEVPERDHSGGRSSQGRPHHTQSVQGGRFSRPNVDDGEDFKDGFRYQKAPSNRPAINHPGVTRRNQPLTGGSMASFDLGMSRTANEGTPERPPIRNHLEDNMTSSHAGDDRIHQMKGPLQALTSNEMLPPSAQGKLFITEEPCRRPQQSDPNSVPARMMAPEGATLESFHGPDKRTRAEVADGSPERLIVESQHKSAPIGYSQPPGSESSGRSSRSSSRLKARLEKSHKRRGSTPFSTKLPKTLAASRERALVLSSPRRRTPSKHAAWPQNQGERTSRRDVSTSKRHGPGNAMEPPPRPTRSNRHTSGSDHAFPGTQTIQRANLRASMVEENSRHRGRETSLSQSTGTMRPESQASNTSRLRDPPSNSHWQASRHYRHASRDHLQQHNQKLAGLTQKWNDFFAHNEAAMDWQVEKIAKLEEALEEKDTTIEAYVADCDTLQTENDELRVSYQEMENERTETSQRVTTMEEKLRSYRQQLNDAVSEHQQLYTRCRERCKETIAQINTEKQGWKASVEKELAASNSTRVVLQEKVASVVADARKNTQELQTTITVLQTQLEEREKEVVREKEHVNDLRSQLDKSHVLQEQTLQSIVDKGKELLEKSAKQEQTSEESRMLVEQQNQKLDAIIQALEKVKTTTIDPQTLQSAMSDLREAVSSCGLTAEATTQLQDGIESIRLQCNNVCEQMFNSEAASDWQERYHEANLEVQSSMQEIESLDSKLEETRGESQRRQEALEILQTQLTASQRMNAEELIPQIQHLQRILDEKDESLRQSQEKLKVAEQDHKRTLKRAQQQQTQAIKQALGEETAELLQRNNDLQKHLDAVTRDNTRHSSELDKVRQDHDNAQRRISELVEDLRDAVAQRESFKPGHGEWSRIRREMVQMRQIIQQLGDEMPEADMKMLLVKLVAIEKKLSKKLGAREELTLEVDAPSSARQRQVQLKLSENGEKPKSPISVQQEKNTRRQSGAVRGIMKPTTRSMSKEMSSSAGTDLTGETSSAATQLAPKVRPVKRGPQTTLNTHTSYNRIVTGAVTSSKDDKAPEDEGQSVAEYEFKVFPKGHRRSLTDYNDGFDEPELKRQRSSTSAGEKPKLDPSKSASHTGSSQASKSQPSLTSTKPRPPKKPSRTYGSQQSRSSRDDSQISVASSATMRSTSSQSSSYLSQTMATIQNGFPQLEMEDDI